MGHLMRRLADERGVVVDFFVKVLLGLAITAVVIFDTGSILVNFFTLDSTAQDIAVEVTTTSFAGRITQQTVETEARALAEEAGARLVRAELDTEGFVHIELRRDATTVIVGRIGAIKSWGVASAESTVRAP